MFKATISLGLILCCILLLSCKEEANPYKIYKPLSKAYNGFISFDSIPDGNYRVHVRVGSEDSEGHTVIRGESRRLFYDGIKNS